MRDARITRLTALLLALLCALPLGVPSAQADARLAYVSTAVSLRSQPSGQAAVLCTVPAGSVVVIIGESGGYCQAVYEGITGWAPRQYLTAQGQAATQAPAAAAYVPLKSGSKGESVRLLQDRLKALGYYAYTADGSFGSKTAAAVRAFQKKNGLAQTGIADSATQALLYSAAAAPASQPAAAATPTPLATNAPAPLGKAVYPFTTYTLSSVNLRKYASTSSERILTVPRGAEIRVLALTGDYAKITYKNRTGYIVSEYASIPAQYLPGKTLAADSQAQQRYPALQSGSSGKNVKLLQEALAELGYFTAAADGVYGSSTLSAVKAFQKKNGLRQDGAASPEIQKLIFEGRPLNSKGKRAEVKLLPPDADVDMRSGDRGEQVTDLQLRLSGLGYYTGTPTGEYDRATVSAVKKFQKDHNLYVDGEAGAKTRLLLGLLTATATPAPYFAYTTPAPAIAAQAAPTALTALNVTVIRSGVRGEAVAQLQRRLTELGYYTCIADGVYDADDILAVREFQRKNGLTIDGVAGLITQQLLYSANALPATTAALVLPTAAPTAAPLATIAPAAATAAEILRVGSRGDAVRQLQTKLKEMGYLSGSVDGIYGAGTSKAVAAFQRANGLTADGVAGQATLARLYGASADTAVTLLRTGSRGDAVKAMQQRLVALGYLSSASGVFDTVTYRAVRDFQKRNGLSADGIAGRQTLNALASSSAVAAKGGARPTAAPTAIPAAAFRVPDPAEVRYANWYSEIRDRAKVMPDVVIYDPDSGLHFNLHMFSFGKHADCETPTAADTEILYQMNGKDNWTPKYVWVLFSDGRVYIGSIHSHGHEVDHTPGNGLDGHICLHFPRVMTEAEATGPYAVSHQKEINWGWEMTRARIR